MKYILYYSKLRPVAMRVYLDINVCKPAHNHTDNQNLRNWQVWRHSFLLNILSRFRQSCLRLQTYTYLSLIFLVLSTLLGSILILYSTNWGLPAGSIITLSNCRAVEYKQFTIIFILGTQCFYWINIYIQNSKHLSLNWILINLTKIFVISVGSYKTCLNKMKYLIGKSDVLDFMYWISLSLFILTRWWHRKTTFISYQQLNIQNFVVES